MGPKAIGVQNVSSLCFRLFFFVVDGAEAQAEVDGKVSRFLFLGDKAVVTVPEVRAMRIWHTFLSGYQSPVVALTLGNHS